MPTIRIQGIDLTYDEKDIVTFDEGLIGLPHLRRMVLVNQTDIAPLLWLASLDEPGTAFLVVNPRSLFSDYVPRVPDDVYSRTGSAREEEQLLTMAIVLIAPDWQRSTINLRAPLFISARNMRGAQIALTENHYRVDAPLPLAA